MLDDYEVLATKALCDTYGYGQIMSIVSALWRKKLKENGYPTDGAFIPTLLNFVKDDYHQEEDNQTKLYDHQIEEFFNKKRMVCNE